MVLGFISVYYEPGLNGQDDVGLVNKKLRG